MAATNRRIPSPVDVPGLAEKRPSVLKGDSVHVALSRDPDHWFEGRVIDIQDRNVVLRFSDDFKYRRNDTCEVRFAVGRIVIRRMHDAVRTSNADLDHLFFPLESHLRTPPRIDAITAFDSRVAANGPQMQAVTAIVNLPSGALPYVVFGP